MATPLAHLDRSREVLLVWPGETTTILGPAELMTPAEAAAESDSDADGTAPTAAETTEPAETTP
jgi:hypothetical protein